MRLQRAYALLREVGRTTGFLLDVAADLAPGLRMTRRRRLPRTLTAGIIGAEVTSWIALSPSLLPRRWWGTAAIVAVCQAAGHATFAGLTWSVRRLAPARLRRRILFPRHSPHMGLRLGFAAFGTAVTWHNLRGQHRHAALTGAPVTRGFGEGLAGIAAGTAGYGVLLLLGDAAQASVDRLGLRLHRWLPLPLPVAWPLAAAGVGGLSLLLSDRLLVRRILASLSRRAAKVNQSVFPGTSMPWEKERSGSPDSLEPWSAVGSQGRAVLSLGPRARDIAVITGLPDAHEPVRIFTGLLPDRSLEESAALILAEMDRTGAFGRGTIVLQTSAGTGWITDWSVGAAEFLTGGDCATVSMQYSYLPSALSFLVDRDTPVRASRILLDAVLDRLADIPEEQRPRLYVAGESLGAYGMTSVFEDLDHLLATADGAVFSGAPRFTGFIRDLTARRDPGSPERLPVIDGGRRVRFVAHPDHLRHDAHGTPYPDPWEGPRVVIAQHASDPIVWWDSDLFWRRPDWLAEPGARGVASPPQQRLDVFHGMRWFPFVTGCQVGMDQLTSLGVPGGHGHNYHAEMLWYWDAVLGDHARVRLDLRMARRAAAFLRTDAVRR